jgi:hypothetical protein
MKSLAALFLMACTAEPALPLDAPVPDALHRAHAAWVGEDLVTLTASVHEVLASQPSDLARDNALALLDVAFQAHPHLPSNQTLPDGVRRLSLNHIHREGPDGHRFRLVVGGVADRADRVQGVTLTGPGVDAASASWNVTPEQGGHYFELELMDQPVPATDGLYQIAVSTDSGTTTLWAVLVGLTASEVPQVYSPHPGQVLSTSTPTITFEDEPTPESGEHEWAGVGVWIANLPDYSEAWSGGAAEGAGSLTVDTPLADGRYWLGVSRREVRSLGPVHLGRIARRSVPFEIRR